MRAHLAAFALVLLYGVPALGANDDRVRTRLYDENTVVPIPGHERFQSTIAFAADEHIENIAVGDSMAWQVTPNKRANLLFLKPVLPQARTNMTVATDKRLYMFDLIATDKTSGWLYTLRFTYPTPAPSPAAPAKTVSADPSPRDQDVNFAWELKGDKRLFPSHVFDDGHAIYLNFAQGGAIPAILAVDPDGTEGPVNYAVRGDAIVVDGMAKQLVLRTGEKVATLTNVGAWKPSSSTAK